MTFHLLSGASDHFLLPVSYDFFQPFHLFFFFFFFGNSAGQQLTMQYADITRHQLCSSVSPIENAAS